jgi:hypothetical protein
MLYAIIDESVLHNHEQMIECKCECFDAKNIIRWNAVKSKAVIIVACECNICNICSNELYEIETIRTITNGAEWNNNIV